VSTLEFRGASVRFGSGRHALNAVDGVDLTVPEGAVVGLVGESGSGKSTLAKAAVGLVPLSAGQITLDGQDVVRGWSRTANRPIQMVFQDPYSSLDPRMTIGGSIAEALVGVRGRGRKRDEVRRLLDLVQLDPSSADMHPSALSGGQRQRVALARALAARPKVVIADEMTSALDVSVQGAVLNLVRSVASELGLSMLFISHNLAVVRYVSDVVAVMYLGRIVEVAPTAELLANARHPYTRALLDSAPRLGSSIEDPVDDAELARIRDEDPPDPHHPPAGCRFHPRCPVGPRIDDSRRICLEQDPAEIAAGNPHHAACHFALDRLGVGSP
jgi:peptide/nickel transport system ATP-binding protein